MTNQTRKSKTVQIVILLMTAICMLAAMLILAACDKNGAASEQNPPTVETIETDYSMNYLFEGKDATEVNFVYKPKYSGRYVFTAAENSLLPTLNGVKIEQGQVDYYDQNKEYLFNFKVTNPTHYNVVAVDMRPEEIDMTAHLDIKRNTKYLMLCHISEPALYTLETGGCDFKVYDSSYKQIESVGNDSYFLGSAELEYVFIVLDRFLYYEDITVDFEISKKVLEKITVDKSQPFEPMQISGKAGEVKCFELEVCEDITSNDKYKFYIYYFKDNSPGWCELYFKSTFGDVHCFLEQVAGPWNEDMFCIFYVCASIKQGEYYLLMRFEKDSTVNLLISDMNF